jgi:hypothetical protein
MVNVMRAKFSQFDIGWMDNWEDCWCGLGVPKKDEICRRFRICSSFRKCNVTMGILAQDTKTMLVFCAKRMQSACFCFTFVSRFSRRVAMAESKTHKATMIVSTIVVQDGKILLVQEAKPSCRGQYYLPGSPHLFPSLYSFPWYINTAPQLRCHNEAKCGAHNSLLLLRCLVIFILCD